MRGLSKRTIELIDFARELLEAFHPMNLRQLHYQIFSAEKINYQNIQADYKRLSRVTSAARRRYRQAELRGELPVENGIPPDWIIDELREGEMPCVWDDAAGYMDATRRDYRRDLWQDQPVYCEVWSEKATVLASLRPITHELGVRLRPCRGYGSCGMENDIGYLFEDIEKPIHIFFLGDFDPSGDDIERDIHKRTQNASGRTFTVTRLAIHKEDIRRFRLPPKKIKDKDSRSAGFRKKHGNNASTVELDALPVEELRRRVREAIEGLIDWNRWNRQVRIQEVELGRISEVVEQFRTLPPSV
jgi:hypothetical protein